MDADKKTETTVSISEICVKRRFVSQTGFTGFTQIYGLFRISSWLSVAFVVKYQESAFIPVHQRFQIRVFTWFHFFGCG